MESVNNDASMTFGTTKHYDMLSESEFASVAGSRSHSKMPSAQTLMLSTNSWSTELEKVYLFEHRTYRHRTLEVSHTKGLAITSPHTTMDLHRHEKQGALTMESNMKEMGEKSKLDVVSGTTKVQKMDEYMAAFTKAAGGVAREKGLGLGRMSRAICRR